MADFATESANKASLADGAIKNAPPTPPETQASVETKLPQSALSLTPVVSEPVKVADAAPAQVPIAKPQDEETSRADPVPIEKPIVPVAEVASKVAVAEDLGAQPDKPEAAAAAPIALAPSTNGQSAGQNGELKEAPKPVSVEDIQDAELPASKTLEVKDVPHPEASKEPEADPPTTSATDAAEDTAKPTVTTYREEEIVPKTTPSLTAPEPSMVEPQAETQAEAPAEIPVEKQPEPQVGDKRNADDLSGVNGDTSSPVVVQEPEVPAEKKQKTNGGDANGPAKKAGRPKKEKKAPLPVGKTLRKTRSQGNVDAL